MHYAWIGLMILLPILAHEIGHLIAMRKCGIWVNELGIGLPWGPKIGWTFASHANPGKTFCVSLYPLVLLGAFVRPENEEDADRLSYRDQAFVYGAGVIGNLVFITLALAFLGATVPEHPVKNILLLPFGKIPLTVMLCWYSIIATVFILRFARPITQYLFPIGAIVVLYWITALIIEMPFRDFVENSGGIVAIAQLGSKFSGSTVAIVYYGILVSYFLALTNILPIYPLDLGRTMKSLVEKPFPRIWSVCEKVGIAYFMFLVIFALAGDIRRLIALFY